MTPSTPAPPYLQSFHRLTARIADERKRQEAVARATHGRFNVFTTVLRATDEVRLHTRFLHCLLDPAGLHDCGALFLDLFFATLAEIPPRAHDGTVTAFVPPRPGSGWHVEKEVSFSGGQIDLLLEQANACGFAVENKINAGEQDKQVARYAEYLAGRRYREARYVLYLTPDGRQSATHAGASYLRISYAEHILVWLEKCLAATYAFVPVNQVLLQYREVVRSITGNTLSRQAMNIVADFIFEHPEIIRHRHEIMQGIEVVRTRFLDRLAEGIGKELAQDGFSTRLRDGLFEGRFARDQHGAFIITPPERHPLAGAPFEIWVEHIVKWNDALVVGVESKYKKAPLTAEVQAVLAQMNAALDADAAARRYHKVAPRATCPGSWWPVGSHDLISRFDDAKLAELLARPRAEVFKEYADEIRVYIQTLAAAYVDAARALTAHQESISP